ncbi:hypothetical protein MMC07_000264 [Pseudocyphellaria aurata]|nr:hypothetical protein [Pseudocyphellaria aurata]
MRQIFDFIATPKPRVSFTLIDTPQSTREQTSCGRRSKLPRPPPRLWPHPNSKPVLSRPFANLTGRRHVPVLIDANGVPFLLLKKPQSPYLSRIIRNKLEMHQKQINRRAALEDQIVLAKGEDDWDRIMNSTFGKRCNDEITGSWAQESINALQQVKNMVRVRDHRTLEITNKMREIVEKEQTLANMERDKRRKEKKSIRIAKREREGRGNAECKAAPSR